MDPTTPEEYFAGSPFGLQVHHRVHELLSAWPDLGIRTTKSQVAFRRRCGFAFLWRPQLYLHSPAAEVVLSIALPRRIESVRFKEVVHAAATTWMHHLELRSADDLDDEVGRWLNAAAQAAGPRSAPSLPSA